MNRRTLFKSIIKQNSQNGANHVAEFRNENLDEYTGPWTEKEAAHLLRRTMFGPSLQNIQDAVNLGLAGTIALLTDESNIPQTTPIHPGKTEVNGNLITVADPNIDIGKPWVNKDSGKWFMGALPSDPESYFAILTYRLISMRSWKSESILNEGISIYEKMGLFWHNHFGVAAENGPFEFLLNITLLENALGNFKDLVKKVTLDPAMLDFLNGNENTKQAPNENFARELFELFTIGKGPLAGPGDYTYYTEEDILQASKVLTGWAINFPKLFSDSIPTVELSSDNLVVYLAGAHDTSNKQFSHRFSNTVISNLGSNEYKALIDMIFTKDACAKFICRKLYRWFVYYQITDEVELNIIEPLAELMIMNNYDVQPVVEKLLKSEHFFSFMSQGPMIKNPIDFLTSIMKPFNFAQFASTDAYEKSRFYLQIYSFFTVLQMPYFAPPSVSGWKAYYQEPLFYRTWINATTLNFRMLLTRVLSLNIDANGGMNGPALDVLAVVADINNSTDPNGLIDGLSTLLYPKELTDEQKSQLKNILIPGLPDFEWTVEYGQYLNNPNDENLKNSIEQKLRLLLNKMLTMPEFYLS